MFDALRVARFIFKIKALNDLNLPGYKGSALRGGFGHALKQLVCALKREKCATCLLQDRCVYVYLFETPPAPDAEMMRLYPMAPHPFVIEPPTTDLDTISEGEFLEFGLVLIGNALDYLPYFLYAFMLFGENGLGRDRGQFTLEEILVATSNGFSPVFDRNDKLLRKVVPFPDSEAIRSRCLKFPSEGALTMDFLTPTRIKFDGRLVEKPSFHHLVRSMLRRVSSLSYFHCDRKVDLDFRAMIDRSKEIECISSDLRWHDWHRYSSRQKQTMKLGGFMGRAVFVGSFKDFIPLLAWGEVLHLGKAASFGLGHLRLMETSSKS